MFQKKLHVSVLEDSTQNNPYIQFNIINNAVAEEANSNTPFYTPKKLVCKTNPKYAPSFIIDDTESMISNFEFYIDISKKIDTLKNFKKLTDIIADDNLIIQTLNLSNSTQIVFNFIVDTFNGKFTKNFKVFEDEKEDYFRIKYKTRNKFKITGTRSISHEGYQIVNSIEINSKSKKAGTAITFDYDENSLYASLDLKYVDIDMNISDADKNSLKNKYPNIAIGDPILKFKTQFVSFDFVLSGQSTLATVTETINKKEYHINTIQYDYIINLNRLQESILYSFENLTSFIELKED